MKENISLTEFLRTGEFGPVSINDHKSTVIEKLGQPDGEISLSKGLHGIHYGWYEFVFDNNGLRSIQNDRFDPELPDSMEFSNDSFQVDSGFLKADKIKKLGEIETELVALRISFSLIDYWGRKAVRMTSGVVLDFNDEELVEEDSDSRKIEDVKDYTLIGIRYHPKD